MQDPTMEGKKLNILIADHVDETEETDTLNAHDRCDSCQAQAYVWVNGVSGDLLFCGHHFAKHEDAIRAYAFEIVDERHKLSIKRESSAANAD